MSAALQSSFRAAATIGHEMWPFRAQGGPYAPHAVFVGLSALLGWAATKLAELRGVYSRTATVVWAMVSLGVGYGLSAALVETPAPSTKYAFAAGAVAFIGARLIRDKFEE